MSSLFLKYVLSKKPPALVSSVQPGAVESAGFYLLEGRDQVALEPGLNLAHSRCQIMSGWTILPPGGPHLRAHCVQAMGQNSTPVWEQGWA